MSEEMKKAFDSLDINTKRNQISNELLIINELIKNFENSNGFSPLYDVKSYDQNNDISLTEAEILTFFYEDIYNIEQELITLLTYITTKQNRK